MRKNFVWCVLLGAMLASCGREKVMSGPGSPADSVAGISSDAFDSLLLYSGTEPGEEELPANADELFDDFVFEFSRLKKFQVSRVVFPFPVVASRADTTWIAKAQWRHADLFGGGDYYTVFFNEEEQMELEKSTDLDHVDMDWILLKEHRFRTFHFERRGGKWMLVEESLHALEESPLAGFLDFYGRFVADADFQARSVSDPLRYVTTDPDDDFGMVEGTLDHAQWDAFKPQLPAERMTNIRYGQTYDNPGRMILVKQGIANGLMDILTFKKKKGEWKLVSYEN